MYISWLFFIVFIVFRVVNHTQSLQRLYELNLLRSILLNVDTPIIPIHISTVMIDITNDPLS